MRGNPGAEEPEMEAATMVDAVDSTQTRPAVRLRPARSPDRDGKWPLAARVAFITGSAALLWGLIWLGYRAL